MPLACLERPLVGSRGEQAITEVAGWAFRPDGEAVELEVWVKGILIDHGAPTLSRPDVLAAFPKCPLAALSGFQWTRVREARGLGPQVLWVFSAGRQLKLFVTDGCAGLMAALQTVYRRVPHQRCWVHKMRNLVQAARMRAVEALTVDARAIYNAHGIQQACRAFEKFRQRWQVSYPSLVHRLEKGLADLLVDCGVADHPADPSYGECLEPQGKIPKSILQTQTFSQHLRVA